MWPIVPSKGCAVICEVRLEIQNCSCMWVYFQRYPVYAITLITVLEVGSVYLCFNGLSYYKVEDQGLCVVARELFSGRAA